MVSVLCCKDLAASVAFYNTLGLEVYRVDSDEYISDNVDEIRLRQAASDEEVTRGLCLEIKVLTTQFMDEDSLRDPDGNTVIFKPLTNLPLQQLGDLPRSEWVGKGVFHPMVQIGDLPLFFAWDSGVVLESVWDEHFEHWRANFACYKGTLNYGATNLWVIMQ